MRGADALAAHVLAHRRPGDLVIVSLHWGSNWGYGVTAWQRDFAQRLVGTGAAGLALGYLATLAADGRLASLVMVPLRRRRLRLERATAEEGRWLAASLSRAGAEFGTRVEVTGEGGLVPRW